MKKEILNFLKREKLVTVSTIDEGNSPWICNLYYGIDDDFNIYWVSHHDTKHSINILKNEKVAFNVVWVDPNNLENREAVQGTGVATQVKGIKESAIAIQAMINNIPEWTQWFKSKEFLESLIKSKIYKITPKYIKYWCDEKLGEGNIFELKF